MDTLPVNQRARNIHGVTHKQERFSQEVALMGRSYVDAYRIAFDVRSESKHHGVDAKKLAAIPAVAKRIKMLLSEQKEAMIHDGIKIREHVIKGLIRESDPEHNPSPAARVSALVNLGKIDTVAMFKEHVATEEPRKPNDIEAELKERLRRLLR